MQRMQIASAESAPRNPNEQLVRRQPRDLDLFELKLSVIARVDKRLGMSRTSHTEMPEFCFEWKLVL